MSVMHFTELNSTIMVSYCKLVVTLTSLMSPIPNHAKIDVPEAHPIRPKATKARWDTWRRHGSCGASVACLPLVLRFRAHFPTGFGGESLLLAHSWLTRALSKRALASYFVGFTCAPLAVILSASAAAGPRYLKYLTGSSVR